MKHLTFRLNTHKVSINVQNTELVIFKQKRKVLEHEIKVKSNRKIYC